MAIRRYLFIPLLFCLIAGPSFGQTNVNRTSSITGSIVLPTNQAMERYEILLLSISVVSPLVPYNIAGFDSVEP